MSVFIYFRLFISAFIRQFNVKRYYLSKLNYVILPYFIISLPIVIYYVFVSPPGSADASFLQKPLWLQFVSYYWYGNHAAHFWFIPVIAIFYVVGPILIWAERTNLLYKLLPLLIILSLFIARSTFPTYNFLHFLSIYVIGMLFSKYKHVINPVLIEYKILSLCLILFLSLFLIEYFAIFPNFKTINYLQKIFLIFTTLGFLIKFEHYTNNKLISVFANTSFGVYFLHGYVIYCVYYVSSHLSDKFNLVAGSLPALVFVSFITLTLSTLFVLCIKYVMGSKTHILIGNIPSLKTT